MIFLVTERLILRNLKPTDAPIMYDYRNHKLCSRYQRGQTKDIEGIQNLIAKYQDSTLSIDGNIILAVALKDNDELIGEIVVMPNDGAITLGYTFSYRYLRQGYAFEILMPFIHMLHEMFPQWEFICFADRENIASIALLKKLGYEDLGYSKKVDSQVFGKWIIDGI